MSDILLPAETRNPRLYRLVLHYFRKSNKLSWEIFPMAAKVALVAACEFTRRLAADSMSADAKVFSCWLSCTFVLPRLVICACAWFRVLP